MKHRNNLKPWLSIFALNALLACSAAQAELFKDSKGTLIFQNMYMRRDYKDTSAKDHAAAWAQSFILDYKSGYTEGPVGFGFDILGQQVYKLDGGRGETGTGLVQVDNDGRQSKEFGRLGVSAKIKYRKTELRGGEFALAIPVMRTNGGRAKNQTVEGLILTSEEIPHVKLYAGRIFANSPREEGGMHDMSINGTNPKTSSARSNHFDFLGSEFTFNNKRTKVGVWYARLEDVYKQRYIELAHSIPLTEKVSLNADLGYFNGENDGKSLAGHLDNRVISGLFWLKAGPHTAWLGLQKMSGETKFLRVNGMSGSTLANGNPYTSSFDNPHERSWQLRYDYDFAALKLPGLTFMTRYLRGSNVHSGSVTNGREWARETEIAYAIQSGPAKNLTVSACATVRSVRVGRAMAVLTISGSLFSIRCRCSERPERNTCLGLADRVSPLGKHRCLARPSQGQESGRPGTERPAGPPAAVPGRHPAVGR